MQLPLQHTTLVTCLSMSCGVRPHCSPAASSLRPPGMSYAHGQLIFRHSSRSRPLKLSAKAFSTGLPGRMKFRFTPLRHPHSSSDYPLVVSLTNHMNGKTAGVAATARPAQAPGRVHIASRLC